ncbi:MAG: hypothetical protein ABW170_12700 [Candidatus Thiodiazotropha sp. L084R]
MRIRTRELVASVFLPLILSCFVYSSSADEIERLEPITTTSDVEESSLESAPPLGYHIGKKTLTSTPGSANDPLRVIQALPGVTVNNDTSVDPAVRGSRPEDNSYFVDFLPAGYLFHALGTVSVFNAQLVESFDFYPAGYGAEFSGGTGAVIDTHLRDPHSDELSATLDLSMLQAGALIEGPIIEGHSFYLAGRISYMDLVLEQIDANSEDGVEFVQYPSYTDYQTKYLWQSEDGSRITLQATGASDESEVDLTADSKAAQHEPVLIGTHSNDTSYNSGGVVWEDMPGGDDLTLALGYMKTKTVAHSADAGDLKVEMDNWYARGRWTHPIGTDHLLALGGQISRLKADYDINFRDTGCTEFDVDCSYTDSEMLRSSAQEEIAAEQLYVEENWYPNNLFAVTLGLSGLQEDYLDESFLEPRLRVEYTPQPGWTYSAAYGRYHQMPSFIEVEKVFGNPQLTHFDATHYVLGVMHSGVDGWEWKSELYYKFMDNLVSSDPITLYNNSGEGEAAGIDLMLRKNLTDDWSGWLSFSYSKAERTNTVTGESFPFEYDQPLVVSLVGNYHFNDKWSLGAKWWYHSGVPYTPITDATPDPQNSGRYKPVYGDINSERMPNYHRLDLRLNHNFSKVTVGYVELINAYGQENVSGYEYNADYSTRDEIYQLPTIISFGVTTSYY